MLIHRTFKRLGVPFCVAYVGAWFVAGIALEVARVFL